MIIFVLDVVLLEHRSIAGEGGFQVGGPAPVYFGLLS